MPYVISAILKPDGGRVALHHRNTAMDAIEGARELMRMGMVGVEILEGRIFGPDDFARLEDEAKNQNAKRP
jgi:hypothetical protein